MDKNTVIGMLLMIAVIFGFQYFMTPSKEELQKQQQEQVEQSIQNATETSRQYFSYQDADDLAKYMKKIGGDTASLSSDLASVRLQGDSIVGSVKIDGAEVSISDVLNRSISSQQLETATAILSQLRETSSPLKGQMSGTKQILKLANDSLQIEISNKGAMITRATLPAYSSAHLTDKVEVISPNNNLYGFGFNGDNLDFNTKDYYFTPSQPNDSTVEMTLNLDGGAIFGIRYILAKGGNYMVRMEVFQKNMMKFLGGTVTNMDFLWTQKMSRHEAGSMFEERNSTLYYKYADGDVDYLNEGSDGDETLQDKMKWVAAKNQFFSSVFISDQTFSGMELHTKVLKSDVAANKDFLKDLEVKSTLEYNVNNSQPASFFLYLGPNRHKTLRNYDEMMLAYKGINLDNTENLYLKRLVPLGWTLFRWINEYIVLPVFNWLGSFINSYGIIILLLTLFIKLITAPMLIKSYRSQAVMKILAPDVKAINEKYPNQEDAMKRQQKTMELYRSAGASMLGGCLPMLLQMPILIAVFAFFPSCIELRGQAFLWASDLSAPDAIATWTTQIPFISSTFGNHLSLFCLIMTVTNILYTYISMQSQQSSQMPGMKWMMYLMPVFFLVFFNNYAAGLSYYYFLSLILTIIITYAVRAMVKEDSVRAAMEEYNKKPKKKSGWLARMEEMQKRNEAALREQKKKNRRR